MDAAAIARVFRPDVVAGRVVLVTGGGSGIGQEITVKLAEYGAKVCIMGRREWALQSTMELLRAKGLEKSGMYVPGDVRDAAKAAEVVAKTVERFGKLDVLVNAAAGNFVALSDKMSPNAFRTVIDIDAVGCFTMCRAAFEHLRASDDGCIVNLSATLQEPTFWYQAHACAAKSAVDSITRSLALEWGQFGIRVIAIAPGPIRDTPGLTKLVPKMDWSKEVPVGRSGTKTDVAAAVLFVISPAASFVSGDVWRVDGGHCLYKPPVMPRETLEAFSKKMEKKSRMPKSKL